MTELKLVPSHEPTELERLLLNAAANEKPSSEHKLRVREALGLAIPLAIPVPTAEAAASTGSSGAAAATGASTLAKVLAGGVIGASAVGAAIFGLAVPPKSTPAPAPAAIVVQQAPVARPAAAAPAPTPEIAAIQVSELPVAQAEARAKTATPAKAVPAPSTDDDLRQQIVLIEAARAHVAQHNPWPALQALDTYASKFKGGSFEQEAAVLRMKAVEQTGDRAQASSLARSFLEKNPTSPHVERVQRIAEPSEPR